MQDAFAHCADVVRQADRDRYLAALFAPADRRGALHALHAFNVEITRVREVAHEPLPGEIRLQWWTDVLKGARREEASANPIAAALLATIEAYRLPTAILGGLIEAHRFDLYDEPMGDLATLKAYAKATASALFAMGVQILTGAGVEEASGPAGISFTIAQLLYALPRHRARHQLYVPLDVLDRYGIAAQDVFAGQRASRLRPAMAELREIARGHLATAAARIAVLPHAALPAFLPLATVRPRLDRLERTEVFAPSDLSAWRRQWLIWRAARNPARIAN
jgi:phytoene synthase